MECERDEVLRDPLLRRPLELEHRQDAGIVRQLAEVLRPWSDEWLGGDMGLGKKRMHYLLVVWTSCQCLLITW